MTQTFDNSFNSDNSDNYNFDNSNSDRTQTDFSQPSEQDKAVVNQATRTRQSRVPTGKLQSRSLWFQQRSRPTNIIPRRDTALPCPVV